jgi:hypothetical protein
MKSTIILLALASVLIIPSVSKAQGTVVASTTTANPDVTLSLDIARNMLKAAKGITNNFADFKGDFLQKDGSGNSYYMVKDLNMNTETQFVVLRHGGDYTYAAVYKAKDDSDKIPVLAFTAFTGGITTLTDGNFSVVKDSATQPANTLKYFLAIKGNKIASYSFNVDTKEGTFIVAIQ